MLQVRSSMFTFASSNFTKCVRKSFSPIDSVGLVFIYYSSGSSLSSIPPTYRTVFPSWGERGQTYIYILYYVINCLQKLTVLRFTNDATSFNTKWKLKPFKHMYSYRSGATSFCRRCWCKRVFFSSLFFLCVVWSLNKDGDTIVLQ